MMVKELTGSFYFLNALLKQKYDSYRGTKNGVLQKGLPAAAAGAGQLDVTEWDVGFLL